MRRISFIVLGTLVAMVLLACERDRAANTTDLAQLLAGDSTQGYRFADKPRDFTFPQDHHAHPGFKNEWWYLTGNLQGADERELGYQLTFFRVALAPPKIVADTTANHAGQSAWQTPYIWMAHLAVSDVTNGQHYFQQRFSREALGLAGVQAKPLRVWLEDWSLQSINPDSNADFPWRITTKAGDFTLDITVNPQKPPVLQGEQGLSQKGSEKGNASYYYSVTRLATTGRITIQGTTAEVRGLSWLDREWSTSALSPDQAGWDWFSLQLTDGRDLMYYQLRNKSGHSGEHSAGKWVDDQGTATTINRADITLQPDKFWRAPSGARYPIRWAMIIKGEPSSWIIAVKFPEQEMRTVVNYWEGAVNVIEKSSGRVIGSGYLEMTGY